MITRFDKLEIRCPMLGHQIPFQYCRCVNSPSPCKKIMDCWFERIPIQQYVNEYFSAEEIDKLMSTPKPKIASLLEIVEQAKQQTKNN